MIHNDFIINEWDKGLVVANNLSNFLNTIMKRKLELWQPITWYSAGTPVMVDMGDSRVNIYICQFDHTSMGEFTTHIGQTEVWVWRLSIGGGDGPITEDTNLGNSDLTQTTPIRTFNVGSNALVFDMGNKAGTSYPKRVTLGKGNDPLTTEGLTEIPGLNTNDKLLAINSLGTVYSVAPENAWIAPDTNLANSDLQQQESDRKYDVGPNRLRFVTHNGEVVISNWGNLLEVNGGIWANYVHALELQIENNIMINNIPLDQYIREVVQNM